MYQIMDMTSWQITGDSAILHAARIQARDAFRRNADLKPDDPEAVEAIKHAEEVGKILVENIVQGKKVEGEGDKYSEFRIFIFRCSRLGIQEQKLMRK